MRVTSPENGKSFQGWRDATWQSASAAYASGRTWTREVERITPAAKHFIKTNALSYNGFPRKIRASRTGADMPTALVMKMTNREIILRCDAAAPSRHDAARAKSVVHGADMIVKEKCWNLEEK